MTKDDFGFEMRPMNLGVLGSHTKNKKRSLGKNDKDIVYMRAKRCEGCEKKIDQSEMQVGHKIAYSKNGATTLANSACLCYRCNKLQGTGSLETLKKKLAGTYGKRTKKTTKKKYTKQKSSNSLKIKMPELSIIFFTCLILSS